MPAVHTRSLAGAYILNLVYFSQDLHLLVPRYLGQNIKASANPSFHPSRKEGKGFLCFIADGDDKVHPLGDELIGQPRECPPLVDFHSFHHHEELQVRGRNTDPSNRTSIGVRSQIADSCNNDDEMPDSRNPSCLAL